MQAEFIAVEVLPKYGIKISDRVMKTGGERINVRAAKFDLVIEPLRAGRPQKRGTSADEARWKGLQCIFSASLCVSGSDTRTAGVYMLELLNAKRPALSCPCSRSFCQAFEHGSFAEIGAVNTSTHLYITASAFLDGKHLNTCHSVYETEKRNCTDSCCCSASTTTDQLLHPSVWSLKLQPLFFT